MDAVLSGGEVELTRQGFDAELPCEPMAHYQVRYRVRRSGAEPRNFALVQFLSASGDVLSDPIVTPELSEAIGNYAYLTFPDESEIGVSRFFAPPATVAMKLRFRCWSNQGPVYLGDHIHVQKLSGWSIPVEPGNASAPRLIRTPRPLSRQLPAGATRSLLLRLKSAEHAGRIVIHSNRRLETGPDGTIVVGADAAGSRIEVSDVTTGLECRIALANEGSVPADIELGTTAETPFLDLAGAIELTAFGDAIEVAVAGFPEAGDARGTVTVEAGSEMCVPLRLPEGAPEFRGRFRLALSGTGLAGSTLRLEFAEAQPVDADRLAYQGMRVVEGLTVADFNSAGDALMCEILLHEPFRLDQARLRVQAGEGELTLSARMRADKIAPFIDPALIVPGKGRNSGSLVNRLNLSATSTLRHVLPARGTSKEVNIAAVVPADIAEDLAREPLNVTIPRRTADPGELLPHGLDFLLLVPDGHSYAGGWKSEFFIPDGPLGTLLHECGRRSIPVVVWFTCTSIHASRFDWLRHRATLICETGEASGPDDRDVLRRPVPVQPAMFNPFVDMDDSGLIDRSELGVFLDGWWTSSTDHQEHRGLLDIRHRLSVVESAWEYGYLREADNPAFRWNSLGCITLPERAVVNKFWQSEAFVADSHVHLSMLTKRIRQAIMSDCLPMLLDDGLEDPLIGDLLPSPVEVSAALEPASIIADLAARMKLHVARRRLLQEATLGGLLEGLRAELGLESTARPAPRITVVLVSRRPHLVEECLAKVKAQSYPDVELVYVLHGDHPEAQSTLARVREEGAIALQLDRTMSLAACLNIAIRHASGEYVAKFDDDDFYGADYLSDLVGYRRMVDFDVIGKPSGFYFDAVGNRLLYDPSSRRREWRVGDPRQELVMTAGAAILARRAIFDDVQYPENRRGGADSEFARLCQRAGMKIYSADIFNFVVYRDGGQSFHTWRMTDEQMRSLVDVSPHFSIQDIMI